MAYSETKVLAPTTTPDRHNSQPTGFSGRREATIAPTVASITMNVLLNHQAKTGVLGWERLRTTRRRLNAVSATVSVHSDQASREAARVLIPPFPYPVTLAPSVTTPLYSTTVSQTLRQTSRGRGENELPRTPLSWTLAICEGKG